MSGIAIDASAQNFVRTLEDRECRASGVTVDIARRAVSRRTGIGPGTLANLRRGRIKGVRAWVVNALRAALIAELKVEIARDQHELSILEATDRGDRVEQMAEILAAIETKRRTLNGGEQ